MPAKNIADKANYNLNSPRFSIKKFHLEIHTTAKQLSAYKNPSVAFAKRFNRVFSLSGCAIRVNCIDVFS